MFLLAYRRQALRPAALGLVALYGVDHAAQARLDLGGHVREHGLSIMPSMTSASMALTLMPSPVSKTTTLQGRKRPISRFSGERLMRERWVTSAEDDPPAALDAELLLEVACTSISQSTPKPSAWSAALTLSTAAA